MQQVCALPFPSVHAFSCEKAEFRPARYHYHLQVISGCRDEAQCQLVFLLRMNFEYEPAGKPFMQLHGGMVKREVIALHELFKRFLFPYFKNILS